MYYVKGRVGGLAKGLDVELHFDGSRLTGRIGGDKVGSDIDLEVSGVRVSGRVGGEKKGFDVHATMLPDKLQARLGGLVGRIASRRPPPPTSARAPTCARFRAAGACVPGSVACRRPRAWCSPAQHNASGSRSLRCLLKQGERGHAR